MVVATQFKDFMSVGVSAAVDEYSKLINASTLNRWTTLKRLWPGGPEQLWVTGGTNLVSWIMLEFDDQSADYGINQSMPPTRNPNLTTKIATEWRFRKNQLGWNDHQVTLNINAAGHGENKRKAFKNEKNKIVQNFYTGWFDGLEKMFWATPDTTRMESTSVEVGTPFSIPVFNNENTNGLFPSVSPGGAWTTKAGVNPTSAGKSKWDNQRFPYTTFNLKLAPTVSLIPINLAFLEAWHKTRFEAPPDRQQYFEKDQLRQQVIWCSMVGLQAIQSSIAQYGDVFTGVGNMPGQNNPMFFGVDIEWNQPLDSAKLYMNAGSTALAAEGAIGATTLLKNGPRYYFYGGGLKYAVHRDRWLYLTEPMNSLDQPFSWVQYGDIWHQVHPLNLQKLAIVYPNVANVFV